MAGNSEETGAGAGWLAPLFEQLKAKVQEAADQICKEEIDNIAAAEKVARAVGVVARSARAVDVLRERAEASSEEDEMGGRTYDPEETERIRAQLLVEGERLDRILEVKRAEGIERRRRQAEAALGQCEVAPVQA